MTPESAFQIAKLGQEYYEQCTDDAEGDSDLAAVRLANELALAHTYIRANNMADDFQRKCDLYDMHLANMREIYE